MVINSVLILIFGFFKCYYYFFNLLIYLFFLLG